MSFLCDEIWCVPVNLTCLWLLICEEYGSHHFILPVSLTIGKMFCKIRKNPVYFIWFTLIFYVYICLCKFNLYEYMCKHLVYLACIYSYKGIDLFSAIVALSSDIFSEIINMNSFQILYSLPSSSDHHIHLLLEENFILVSNKTVCLRQICHLLYYVLCY